MSDIRQSDSAHESLIGKARAWLANNLFFLLACGLSAWVLFRVPQVTNLWQQLPLLPDQKIWFGIMIVLFFIMYLTTMLLFWKPRLIEAAPRWIAGPLRLLFAPARLINGWLEWVTKRLLWLSRGPKGWALSILMMAIGGYGMVAAPLTMHWPYIMVGGFLRTVSLLLLLIGGWLAWGQWSGPAEMTGPTDEEPENQEAGKSGPASDVQLLRRTVWQTCGQVLSWVCVMIFVGETLWVAADFKIWNFSFRLYSIWAIVHVALSVVILGALVDFLQRSTPFPARLLTVAVILAAVWMQRGKAIDDPESTLAVAPTAATTVEASGDSPADWLSTLEKRIDTTPEGPLVLVAASGGGSRTAMFTSLVLQMLATEPMDLPAARASSPDNPPGQPSVSDDTQSTWADHIAIISSVSGGSLATARFLQNGADTTSDLQYTSREELLDRTLSHIEYAAKKIESQKKSASPGVSGVASELRRYQHVRAALQKVVGQTSSDADQLDPSLLGDLVAFTNGAFSSKIADEMCMDFMAPILRGFLVPFATRGEGLYTFWEHQFRWESHYQSSSRTTATRPLPLALINASDVEAGRRVIVGFPPLPQGFLIGSPRHFRSGESNDMSGRVSDFSPLCLCDFAGDKRMELSLTRAVRLSSNFPFGFHVSELSDRSTPRLKMTDKVPIVRGQESRTALRLIDGGVVDNTGIDSIHAVMKSLRVAAAESPTGREARVLEKMRGRGVVIVEIDSGAKPVAGEAANRAFAAITLPLQALNNAIYTNALRTSDDHLGETAEAISDSADARRIAQIRNSPPPQKIAGVEFAMSREELIRAVPAILEPPDRDQDVITVLQYRFTCNHIKETSADVMTALALGPADKSIVMAMFLIEAARWKSTAPQRKLFFQQVRELEGLGEISEEEAAILASQLMDRATIELDKAYERLGELAEKMNHRPPQSDAEKAEVMKVLWRPFTLLMAVRELADPTSNAFASKGDETARLAEIVDELFQSDSGSLQMLANNALQQPSPPNDMPFSQSAAAADLRNAVTAAKMVEANAKPRSGGNVVVDNRRDLDRLSTRRLQQELKKESNRRDDIYRDLEKGNMRN